MESKNQRFPVKSTRFISICHTAVAERWALPAIAVPTREVRHAQQLVQAHALSGRGRKAIDG
ncbi:MAG: hypothetical protein RR311_12425, partial [Comamonas sp.]